MRIAEARRWLYDRPVTRRSIDGSRRSGRPVRLGLLALLVVPTVSMLFPTSVAAQGNDDVDEVVPEQVLADRYAPVVIIKAQDGPCDTGGEPFEPAPVEIVLDNPEVFLRQVGNDDPVAMRGPGGRDLFDLREGWYLDFPGDALDPGCIFEQDFRRFYDGRSVVYAHVAEQADRPGMLALQYWFWWYHNPAKNDHEGDWEFIQLLFEADSVAEALAAPPVAVGYAQHTGGERASWDDDKLERDGDRPIVYAARGSHASYFGSALYLGRSSREGFGCDDTDGPSRRLDPDVILLPDGVDDPDDPFAWLAFQGRWGQREAGFFNGPTGPYAKARWAEPVTWHESLRSSSVVIPGGDRVGDGVVSTFCGAVEVGSTALVATLRSPAAALVTLAVLIGSATFLTRRTRWGPVTTRPLVAERRTGQILRGSWRVWLPNARQMLTIGLVYVPVAVVTSIVQAGLLAVPFVSDLIDLAGDRSGTAFLLAMAVGGIADVLTFVYVAAAVARVVDDTDASGPILPSADEVRRLALAVAKAAFVVVVLLVSIVGIPWAIRQFVRYQFIAHAVVLEGADPDDALGRSSELVAGRWWWTAGLVLGVEVAAVAAGFLVAVAVLLAVPALPLWAFNVVAAGIHLVLVPIAAAAVGYAYGTLAARSSAAEQGATDELVPA